MASRQERESSLAALRRQEAELLAEIRDVSAALEPPAAPAAEKPKPVTHRMKDIALRLYALAGLKTDAPLRYLMLQGRAASEADVCGWYAALPAPAQAALVCPPPEDRIAARRLSEARKFFEELSLVTWVREQNLTKGVAPTSGLILERAGSGLVRSGRPKNRFRWVRRFMKHWGGQKGRFGHGDELSQEEFRAKVRLVCSPDLFGGRGGTVVSGPRLGPASRVPSEAVPYAFPSSGPQLRPAWRVPLVARSVASLLESAASRAATCGDKAFGSWWWGGFLQECGRMRKPVLLVNMDETSVRLCPRVREGWVFAEVSSERRDLLRRGPAVSHGESRACLTLVAFLADRPELQRLLPQVFLTNEHTLSKADVDFLIHSTPENTFFCRRKSSWINHTVLVDILSLLAASLGEVMDTHQVVLSMDTYKAHLHRAVVRECGRLGFLLHFVPAAMTKWLQPLDVLVFKKYKDWIVSETERRRSLAPGGRLTKVEVLGACAAGIAVLEGESWAAAFELAGMHGQGGISSQLRRRLGSDGPVSVRPGLLSAADMLAVYPRRSTIPVDELFGLAVRLATLERPRLLSLPARARLTGKTRPPALPPPASPPPAV